MNQIACPNCGQHYVAGPFTTPQTIECQSCKNCFVVSAFQAPQNSQQTPGTIPNAAKPRSVRMPNSMVNEHQRRVHKVSFPGVAIGIGVAVLIIGVLLNLTFHNEANQSTIKSNDLAKPAPIAKNEGIIGIGIKQIDKDYVVQQLVLGWPGERGGIRLGDHVVGVGESRAMIRPTSNKTIDELLDTIRGMVGQPVYLEIMERFSRKRRVVELVRDQTIRNEDVATINSGGFSLVFPHKLMTHFATSPRDYDLIENESELFAFPEKYDGKRVTVFTRLLFPRVDQDIVSLQLFNSSDSIKGYVRRSTTPRFFESLVKCDPKNRYAAILHVRLRSYQNSDKLYGEIEEALFVDAPPTQSKLTEATVMSDSELSSIANLNPYKLTKRPQEARRLSQTELRAALTGQFKSEDSSMTLTFIYPAYTIAMQGKLFPNGNTSRWDVVLNHLSMSDQDRKEGCYVLLLTAPDAPNTPLPCVIQIELGGGQNVSAFTARSMLGVRFPKEKQLRLVRQRATLPSNTLNR